MKTLIFTKEDGPEQREALEFGARLESENYQVRYIDADEESATSDIELYDVYSYPTFVVIRDDGSEVESWRGVTPIAGDIKNFLNQ
jgi:hypothetical protein